MFEVGRICLKTAGREAGRYCVIVETVDKDYVVVTGPKSITKVRRRRSSIRHLEPTPEKIEIKPKATDEEVLKEYEKHDLYKKLGIEISEVEERLSEERKLEKAEKKAEHKPEHKAEHKVEHKAEHKPEHKAEHEKKEEKHKEEHKKEEHKHKEEHEKKEHQKKEKAKHKEKKE
jgi:large subunit ribosomal protein L14e